MSKASLITTLFVVVALAGMAVWMMNLEARQQDAGPSPDSSSAGSAPARSGEEARRLSDLEQKLEKLGLEVASQRTRLNEVEGNLGDLRLVQEEFAERLGSQPASETAPAATVAPEVEGDLKSAIEAVLTAREQEAERRRSEERSRRFAGWLVSGVDLADGQRAQVEQLFTRYMAERQKIGQQYSGDNPDTQGRDAAIAELDQRRNDELVRIVGSANFQKMEERLNRLRGGGDRGGDRGRGPGRPRGGGR